MELYERELFTSQELSRAVYSNSHRFTLYRLYDEDNNLIYVGITRELKADLEAHETPLERQLRKHRNSGIPRKWTRVESEDFDNLLDALIAERS
jgi:predicted GIY-YIG superfamily endonuclease